MNLAIFLTESDKNDEINPKALVFGFTMPTSADPINVYNVMFNSIKYYQKKIGGQIVNTDMLSNNKNKEYEYLKSVLLEMKKENIIPCSNDLNFLC